MSETPTDLQEYLAVYSGAATADHSWDDLIAKLNYRNLRDQRDADMETDLKPDGSKFDKLSATKRFMLRFAVNLVDPSLLLEMNSALKVYIERSIKALDALDKELSQKADMAISQDRISSTLIAQTQVQIIHRLSNAAQNIEDIARGKVLVLQGNSKFLKAAVTALENFNTLEGRLLDSRDMAAYVGDIKNAQLAYDEASKRVSAIADRASSFSTLALRRDSAIRMLIQQLTSPGGGAGRTDNTNPDSTGNSQEISDYLNGTSRTGTPPGFTPMSDLETSI